MKYFDTTIGTGTNEYRDDTTTIPSSDERVREFFKPLPDNHRLEFTEEGLPLIVEIPSPTQADLDQRAKDKRIAEIDKQLNDIDFKSIRSIRRKSLGTDIQADRDKLTKLNNDADILRAERKTLTE